MLRLQGVDLRLNSCRQETPGPKTRWCLSLPNSESRSSASHSTPSSMISTTRGTSLLSKLSLKFQNSSIRVYQRALKSLIHDPLLGNEEDTMSAALKP